MQQDHITKSKVGAAATSACSLIPHSERMVPVRTIGRSYGEYSTPPDTDGLTLRNWDVPCAVCQSAQNGVFMLPGRDKCYDGWITEYTGWLAAQHIRPARYRTEFVCVDEHGERGGSVDDKNGALFAPVQAKCGSLPCDVYPTGEDLKCVCSR